jgi:quercetin dioxygenase-like cupin family protein
MANTLSAPPAPQPLWFIDNLAEVHLDGEQTGGAWSLVELSGRRGDMPPLHVHRNEDEAFYVLDGELRVWVGDAELVVPAGRAAFAPRDVPHTYRVTSESARWLALANSAGFERFVRAVAEPAPAAQIPPAGREHDAAVLAQIAAAHDIELLGPPGMLPNGRQA